MKTLLLITAGILGSSIALAQPNKELQKHLEDQVPHKKKYDATVVDKDLGIDIYEPLNMFLNADSVRMCDGYDCEGWVTDNYENGQVIHKGFYVDGQLKVYKNYYPDGTLERNFVTVDNYRCTAKLYYPDGTLKSEIKYLHGEPMVWSDFYEDGKPKYYEEYHKSLTYHIEKKSYFKTGNVEDELILLHKKKLNYDKNEYHTNGNMKIDGNMVFNQETFDYAKTGVWKHYDENGTIKKELTYSNGRVKDEKNY